MRVLKISTAEETLYSEASLASPGLHKLARQTSLKAYKRPSTLTVGVEFVSHHSFL